MPKQPAVELRRSSRTLPPVKRCHEEIRRNLATNAKTDKLPALHWKHNALRHSFISYRVAEIQDVAKVALEAGNSPSMILESSRWDYPSGPRRTGLGPLTHPAPSSTRIHGFRIEMTHNTRLGQESLFEQRSVAFPRQ